ncbi:MAG: primase C-terminal domain-containing protein [Planctomycetes bacterium]|nr:primase C-terminal domain-containing protein [Planctomycetota bacterium]
MLWIDALGERRYGVVLEVQGDETLRIHVETGRTDKEWLDPAIVASPGSPKRREGSSGPTPVWNLCDTEDERLETLAGRIHEVNATVAPPRALVDEGRTACPLRPLCRASQPAALGGSEHATPRTAFNLGWIDGIAVIPEGMRNDSVFRLLAACRARGADDDLLAEVAGEINEARCAPPLAARERDGIVRSVRRNTVGPSRTRPDPGAAERARAQEVLNAWIDAVSPGLGRRFCPDRRALHLEHAKTGAGHGMFLDCGRHSCDCCGAKARAIAAWTFVESARNVKLYAWIVPAARWPALRRRLRKLEKEQGIAFAGAVLRGGDIRVYASARLAPEAVAVQDRREAALAFAREADLSRPRRSPWLLCSSWRARRRAILETLRYPRNEDLRLVAIGAAPSHAALHEAATALGVEVTTQADGYRVRLRQGVTHETWCRAIGLKVVRSFLPSLAPKVETTCRMAAHLSTGPPGQGP